MDPTQDNLRPPPPAGTLPSGGSDLWRAAHAARRRARWLGWVVELVGVVVLAGSLWRTAWWNRAEVAERLLTPGVVRAASGATALVGLLLVLVGRGVARRRRAAWALAVAVCVQATAAHLLNGLNLELAAVTGALAGVLIWQRHLFVVPATPARLAGGARLVAISAVVTVLYGLGGLYLNPEIIEPRLTLRRAGAEVAARLVGLPGPLRVGGRFGHWFPPSITLLSGVTLALALLAVLAPVALRGGGPMEELPEVAALVDRADGDTLDPFVLRRDKRRIFSPDGRAAIGFRYVEGVALAAGDPVGEPEAFPAAVHAFVGRCDALGWRPAVMGARGDRLGLYEPDGLHGIYIGDEAVIDVAGFTLAGGTMRNARHAVNRTRRLGLTTEMWREGELDDRLRHQLLAIAAGQRGRHREFGFSMTLGDVLERRHPRCLIVVCRDRDGQPLGFERYVPCRAGRALSLDAMSRRLDAPNGVHERMIADTVDWARAHGVEEVSLNFAAFRSLLDPEAGASSGSGAGAAGAAAWLLRQVDGTLGLQLDTLRQFNAKFRPRWVPRYVIYRSLADIPAIGLAALSAEGFLPLDRGRQELEPAVPAAARAGTA